MSVVVSGSVGLANMRLSAVAGTAFVDFSSLGALAPYLYHTLTITDSALKTLVGYIRAVGTGETTLELIVNGDNEAAVNTFVEAARATNAQSNAVAHGGTYSEKVTSNGTPNNNFGTMSEAVSSNIATIGKLIKSTSLWVYNPSIGGVGSLKSHYFLGGTSVYGTENTTKDTWIQFTLGYKTTVYSANYSSNFAGVRTDVITDPTGKFFYTDDRSVLQVLTPSATGVTISSTAGGATYNWESQTSGFNYNDSAGYTYTIDTGGLSLGSLMLMGMGR